MTKLLVLIGAALAVGLAAYFARYERAVSSFTTPTGTAGELAWLKSEFHLDAAEYAKVVALHRAYRPVCASHCVRYGDAHRRLAELLQSRTQWSPETGELIAEEARVQGECHAAMLKYAYGVAACMSPEEGRRYLAMIKLELIEGDPAGMFAAAR